MRAITSERLGTCLHLLSARFEYRIILNEAIPTPENGAIMPPNEKGPKPPVLIPLLRSKTSDQPV